MTANNSQNLRCPNCRQTVSANTRHCPHCQVDLAFAALAVEQAIAAAPLTSNPSPTSLEALVPRIGELLVGKGLIQPEWLRHALNVQEKKAHSGKPMLIGEILVELDYISRPQLDGIVTQHVLQLQTALTQSNRQLESEVQQRTKQLQTAMQKMVELNQIKQNFIANISHELRTPLGLLTGYLDLLSNGALGDLIPAQAGAIISSYSASQRLHRLIEDLLQFTSAANGDIPLDMASLTLDLPVKTAVSLTQPRAQARKIGFKKQVSDSLPPVIADNKKITWVVEQFLDNAIKFTPPGGQVVIETAPLRGDVIVKVTDTGIGIPESRINEIFEPFHQLDGSTTRHHEGTGLGLALANNIVQAHGSAIKVESYLGQGSSFSFALPAMG